MMIRPTHPVTLPVDYLGIPRIHETRTGELALIMDAFMCMSS